MAVGRSLAIYYGLMPLRARRMARLYARFVRPDSLCFDVGAHVGNRVRCWRGLGGRVVAVEPHPDLVTVLGRLYGRDPQVHLVAAGLGARAGRAPLLADGHNLTVATLSPDWAERMGSDPAFRGIAWRPQGEVEVTTLDALIARFGRPDFVKIDVEGLEAEVLAGLSEALPAISFEYLAAAREVALVCVDRLEALAAYRYNWSPGESHRLASAGWLDAEAIRGVLADLAAGSGSGDVYARLIGSDRRPGVKGP
ncbi:MAG: FkbM family methyltransferase [Chromatiaceae bacterium]|nr:FkbM family methyltransferase [Chromatiaceae bacterium]